MTASRPFDRAFPGEMPLPLARLYARAHHAKGERERHDHAFHLVETALKLAASALIGQYRTCGERSPKVDATLQHLALPSLGQWRDIFRETLNFLGRRQADDPWSKGIFERLTAKSPDPGRQAIFSVFVKAAEYAGKRRQELSILDCLDLLPTYRNAMSDAHGSIKSDTSVYVEGTGALLDLAAVFLREAKALGGGHLVFSEEVKYGRANERRVVWMDLTGPTAIRRQPFDGEETLAEILPGQLFLEIGPRLHLPLHPLLFYQPAEVVDQVFFLNRARGGKSGVQFLSYATGEFYLPGRDPSGDELIRDLERLLSWVTASAVDQTKLEALGALSRSDAAKKGDARPEAEGARPTGRVFGDFEILGELGRGGMAVVYKARQLSLDRLVALKVLPPGMRNDPVAVGRFKQEVRALSRCDHPNVVKILSSGQAEGTFYYAMEFIDGADLAMIARALDRYRSMDPALREGHFDLATTTASSFILADHTEGLPQVEPVKPEALPQLSSGRDITFRMAAVMRDAARGVQHIHEHGIIHRDLKPQNMMVTRERHQPVIMDLGLAKMSGVSQSLTMDKGRLLGTMRYMAPEQLQRHLLEVDARADVYALGAVLFELSCNRPMLDGDTEERLTAQILLEETPNPQKANPKIPSDLAIIIRKATHKDPKQRYLSAEELAEDLDRFVHGEAIQARPPTIGYLLKVFLKRHRVEVAAALVLVLLVAGFFAGNWFLKARKFRQTVAEANAGFEKGNEGEVKAALVLLEEQYPEHPTTYEVSKKLEDLRLKKKAERSRDHLRDGKEQWETYQQRKGEVGALRDAWSEAVRKHRNWEPVWFRDAELAAWSKWKEAERGMDELYHQALLSFSKALEEAPPKSEELEAVKRTLAGAFWTLNQEALKGSEDYDGQPGFFQNMIESLGLNAYVSELQGGGKVTIGSDPPGAEVFCFRYEDLEARLVPVPFDPKERKPAGRPFLLVEAVYNPKLSPLQAGDRLLAVAGKEVHTASDFARTLEGVAADAPVELRVLRNDKEETLTWKPFPAEFYRELQKPLEPGRVVNVRDQFGFNFAGYPLDFVEACRVGRTGAGAALEVELPKGSYLFVLRKEGYRDARLPVAVPRKGAAEKVRLLREAEIPEGFVYVPEGSFFYGGDRKAFQSFVLGEERLPGFFISRLETTVGDYLKFLNDPQVFARTGSDGTAEPTVESVKKYLEQKQRKTPLVVPLPFRVWKFERGPGGWTTNAPADVPVYNVPFLAALEYAAWRTGKDPRGFRYRLPTDKEWEKAARGADQRTYVWGNYMVWSFCACLNAVYMRKPPSEFAVGVFPFDESVFGVRDLGGMVSEETSDQPAEGYAYTSQRGGNWYTTDEYIFRTACRNGRLPENPSYDSGFRLVAELKPAAGTLQTSER